MPIAFDAASRTNGNTNSLSWSHICSGSNRILVVMAGTYPGSPTVNSVTYGGQALTYLCRGTGTYGKFELWYKLAPLTGANNIIITFSASDYCVGGAASFTGVGSIDNCNGNYGSSSTPSLSVSSVSGNYWAVGGVFTWDTTITSGAGQTQRWDLVGIGNYSTNGCTDQDGAFSWTLGSSNDWAAVGARLVPSEDYSGTALISGGGDLAADGEKGGEGTATISAGGSVSASGSKAAEGTAAISGGGSLIITYEKVHPVFVFTKDLISEFNYIENIDELKNHIIIEGEEYSIYDELYRILDGTEIMYTLDDIPDGDSYGRMALTSISAGKIIIAGCDAEVTDQMFTAPAARNNVEAWKHASDVTLIDGGKIYTHSIVCDKLLVGSDANTEDTLDVFQGEDDTQILRLRSTSINHQITQGGGLGYDWGTHTDCYAYMRKDDADKGGLFIASFTEATHDIALSIWGIYGDANNLTTGNASGGITLAALRGNPATHGYQACEADDNIFVIKTQSFGTDNYQAKLILKQGGYLYIEGTYETFQNEDDIKLVKELEDILSSKSDIKRLKEKDVYKKHKVVNVNEVDGFKHGKDGKLKKTGKKRLDRFVNTQAKDMLLYGAIRQLGNKNQALEKRLNKLEAK